MAIEALREASTRWGAPEIVNTDQGSQFSSADFVAEVKGIGARQSMDGKGCWRDNVFVERLWRSVKHEDVYLKAYDGVSAARHSLAVYFEFYNARRTGATSTRCRRCRPQRDGLNHEYMGSTGPPPAAWQEPRIEEVKPQPIQLSQAVACSNEWSHLCRSSCYQLTNGDLF